MQKVFFGLAAIATEIAAASCYLAIAHAHAVNPMLFDIYALWACVAMVPAGAALFACSVFCD